MGNEVPRFKIDLDGIDAKQKKEIKNMLTPSKNKISRIKKYIFVKDRRTKTGLRLKQLKKGLNNGEATEEI